MKTEDVLKIMRSTGMHNFHEYYGDVFGHFEMRLDGLPIPYMQKPNEFYLLQCISGDMAMGAGIAREIETRYGFKSAVIGDFAESFPGFKRTDWIFDKRKCEFFKIPLIKTEDGEYGCGEKQVMRFDKEIGSIVMTEKVPNIIGLVTKEHYYEKPTLYDMRKALTNLRDTFVKTRLYPYDEYEPYAIEFIAPHIGCGLDKLDWDDVRDAIIDVFRELMAQDRVIFSIVNKEW